MIFAVTTFVSESVARSTCFNSEREKKICPSFHIVFAMLHFYLWHFSLINFVSAGKKLLIAIKLPILKLNAMASTALKHPITNYIVKEFDTRALSLWTLSLQSKGNIVATTHFRFTSQTFVQSISVTSIIRLLILLLCNENGTIIGNRIHKLHKDWSILIGILDGSVHSPNGYEISGLFDISTEHFPGDRNSFISNQRLQTMQQTLYHRRRD